MQQNLENSLNKIFTTHMNQQVRGCYFDVQCILLTMKGGFMVDMVVSVNLLNVAKCYRYLDFLLVMHY